MKILKTLFLLFFAYSLSAQDAISITNGCNFSGAEDGEEYYAFDPSVEAAKIVKQILDGAGALSHSSIIVKESNVKNALATTLDKRRYILYSTTFLEKFKGDAKTKWAAYTVLAHEIGHHLNGHDLTEKNPKERKRMELEADKFAGAICRTLGATLAEAVAGMESMPLEGETITHPPKSARTAAIANGWKQQDDVLKNPSTNGKGEMESAVESLSGKIYQKYEGADVILLSAKRDLNITTFSFLVQNNLNNTIRFRVFIDPGRVTRTSIADLGEYDEAEDMIIEGKSAKFGAYYTDVSIADQAYSNFKVVFKGLKPMNVVPELRVTIGVKQSGHESYAKKTLVFRNIPLPYELKQ